ncbi:MAG: single-stranded-DNA-specific exonuclease RecJ [Gammaproteobacteria bacterium]|nr:single-stranded-DNA-specific exonuclease RecJ [Gammaproteobacteria bacterium]
MSRRAPQAIPAGLAATLPPLLAQLYANRGVTSQQELDYSLERLPPFDPLKGIAAAVALLHQALQQRWRILVVGDFDADGATSTAVAVKALRLLGAGEVDFLVPNRFEYGYGLTPEIVAVAATRRPQLIVTVDNGISSVQGVVAAQQAGIKVLVTDHHLPGAKLPPAEAMVNPNQPGDRFPCKHLAGVGVIFYVMLALRRLLREQGWFAAQGLVEPNLAQLLDLVALGTVADVVTLDHTNRILVAQGVARIRAGRASPGIQALCEAARRDPARLVASDLGFGLGPRLNAAGRMEDMSIGIACLLSESLDEARRLAARLEALNHERRAVEGAMRDQALAEVERLHLKDPDSLPFGFCLYNPDWHEGVIGILASRIKDRLHRPVIVFTDAANGEIKGSARSVKGVHIRDALDAVAAAHPELLKRFGGHAMAAGLTIARRHLETFKQAFDAEVRRHLSAEELHGTLVSDGELTATQVTMELAARLRNDSPWGQGFAEPLFDGWFEVAGGRVVGERHLKLQLQWPDSPQCVDAIAFNVDEALLTRSLQRIQIAYRLDINEWRGNQSLQLLVETIVAVA